jgi:hypothetical protein
MIPSNRDDQNHLDQTRLNPQQPAQPAPVHPAPLHPIDDLDHLLLVRLSAQSDPLTPSSGFTQSVMDAVHQHATAPEPIPFPWKRFLPFALALLCVVVAFIFGFFIPGSSHQQSSQAAAHEALPSFLSLSPAAVTSLGYTALAIGLSIVTTILSIKLAVGRR